jgi:hypothetical protein
MCAGISAVSPNAFPALSAAIFASAMGGDLANFRLSQVTVAV